MKLPLDTNGIDVSIYNQMANDPHDLLVHLGDLCNGRKPDIFTLNK